MFRLYGMLHIIIRCMLCSDNSQANVPKVQNILFLFQDGDVSVQTWSSSESVTPSVYCNCNFSMARENFTRMKSWKTIFKPKHSNKVTYLAEMNHIWNSILVLLATTLSNFLCLLYNQPIKYVIISVIEYRYSPCMFLYNFANS